MNLPKIKYKDLIIPEINLMVEKYVRIEIGISHNIEKEKIMKNIGRVYCKLNIKKIELSYELLFWIERLVNKSKTIEDYLKDNGISYISVNTFFKYVSQVNEQIGKETYIKDLNEQQRRVILIFILTNKYREILINTGGMYYSVLKLTYLILRSYIKGDGKCIEVSYPHSSNTDESYYFVTNKAKVIQIGEMRIINKP